MAMFIILKPFKFAHGGTVVEEFAPSDKLVELTDECAKVAVTEKWAKPAKPAKTVPEQSDDATPPAAT